MRTGRIGTPVIVRLSLTRSDSEPADMPEPQVIASIACLLWDRKALGAADLVPPARPAVEHLHDFTGDVVASCPEEAESQTTSAFSPSTGASTVPYRGVLAVRVEDDERVRVHGPGHLEDGLEGGAVPLVLGVADHRSPHPLRDPGRLVGGAVVDDDDTVDELLRLEDGLRDVELLVERGHRGDDVRAAAVVLLFEDRRGGGGFHVVLEGAALFGK